MNYRLKGQKSARFSWGRPLIRRAISKRRAQDAGSISALQALFMSSSEELMN